MVEIVVATMMGDMHKLYERMNAKSDMLIANQAEAYGYEEALVGGKRARMITAPSRGVGLNRNTGLLYAQGDILLLADDDNIYLDGYEKAVEDAFAELPQADAIVFRMQFVKNGAVIRENKHDTRRVRLYNGLSIGASRIAIRKSSLLKANLCFSRLFGGGCIYSSGEDSLFVVDCLRKGLRVYTHAALIGQNIKDTSSWFQGFNEKYFFDKGALAACAFKGVMRAILIAHFMWRFKNRKELRPGRKLRLLIAGCKAFPRLITYEQWARGQARHN